jgi:hypothetical protein
MAPIMVTLMVAVHACAPPRARGFSLTALGWMLVVASLTMTVHFIELTVVRRIEPGAVPGFPRLFGFEWPSLLYAIDIAAWDPFLGLSLLFAPPVFANQRHAAARRGLLLSGSLCLAGLLGPAINVLAWRGIGIFLLRGGVPPHVPRIEPSFRRDSIRWPGRMWPRRDPMKVPASAVLCGRLAPHPHVGFCSLHDAPGSARATERACRPVRAGRLLHQGEGSWRALLRDPRHRTRRLGLPFPHSGCGVP